MIYIHITYEAYKLQSKLVLDVSIAVVLEYVVVTPAAKEPQV